MAFKPINLIPGVGKIKYVCQASTGYTQGNLLVRVSASGYVSNAMDNPTDTNNIEAIVTKSETASAATAYVEAIPVKAVTFVIADCTSNTADNHLNKCHILTDRATVANTSTHIATTAAVFYAIAKVGADSDKKLFGYLNKATVSGLN